MWCSEKNLEQSLLPNRSEVRTEGPVTWDVLFQEVKRLAYVAGPMVATFITLLLLQFISMTMVGHLGELALSSTAIAISLANITGFSLLNGMASALETLCGQAFGARQYRKLGNQTYGAIFSLTLVCLGLSVIWINIGKLLILIGQDPIIAHEAGKFTTCLIPSLVAYATFQPLLRFYQTQSVIIPMLLCSYVTLTLHIPLSWFLVYKSGLNHLGGALAIGISNWLNVIFLGLHMNYSSVFAKTRVLVSMELFQEIGEFFRYAIPSSLMICLTTISILYSIPYGLSAAISTRVSNELGAGNPQAARVAVYSVMILAVTELLAVSGALFASRHVFGYIFSGDKEAIKARERIFEGRRSQTKHSLLQNRSELLKREEGPVTWDLLFQEVKRLAYVAGPMVATFLSLLLLQFITQMMVGHLGELALSSTAIAISLANNGMASALETLCGQAYGAQHYKKLGNQTYGAIFSLLLVCLGLSIIWINFGNLIILIGQDPVIAHEAGKFTTCLIPALVAYATYQPLLRFYQTQSVIIPMLLLSCLTLTLHIPLSWFLVYKSGLNHLGGALAISISNWLNVIFLGLHMRYSSVFAKTRVPVSMELFQEIGDTRVSNELGAGNPQAARVAVYSTMILMVTELLALSGALFASRHVFAYVFSGDKEVVDYVSSMAALLRAKGLWLGLQLGALLQTILLLVVTCCTNWEKQVIAQEAMEGLGKNLGQSLLPNRSELLKREEGPWDVLFGEVKRLAYVAGPMVATFLFLLLLQFITQMMVGHLGELALSSTAIAISLANITGYSLLNGMASALETLCGQAFGAGQYRKLGNQTYGAIFSLILVCLGLSVIWMNIGKILILIGQDPIIAHEAGKFTTCLIPALVAYAIFEPLVRFYQTQSVIIPMLLCSCLTLTLHIPLSWFLVYKSGLNHLGGALAISISNWLNILFCVCKNQGPRFHGAVPRNRGILPLCHPFINYALPSMVVVPDCNIIGRAFTKPTTRDLSPFCLSYNDLNTIFNTIWTKSRQPTCSQGGCLLRDDSYGDRVINGDWSSLREPARLCSHFQRRQGSSGLCILHGCSGLFGRDGGWFTRGCGWQKLGSYVNLASLYLGGIPAAVILGFRLQLRAKGLWLGLQLGALLQTILLLVVTCCTNWEKQAIKARERIFEDGRSRTQNALE
ncbi:hypothetical protein Tsubulata_039337 [Turnera subulata]|uniref:Protein DETOXIFICATION n=1 Tax=Turnera subulata TaxID=218843 RepID=A0A9Q0FH54_9ROSI|nr:hypothetical protein Tsubulata_039337 [Turnera subulata]